MEFRCATEFLVRTSSLKPFVITSHRATRRIHQTALITKAPHKPLILHSPRHTFSSSATKSQQAAAPKSDDREDSSALAEQPLEPTRRIQIAQRHTSGSSRTNRPTSPGRPEKEFDLSTVLKASDQPTPRPAPRPASPPAAVRGGASPPPFDPKTLVPGLDFISGRRQSGEQSRKTSVDELIGGLGLRERSTPFRDGDRQTTDMSRMRRPVGAEPDFKGQAARMYKANLEKAMQAPSFKLGPTLGRTVAVNEQRGVDVARAFAIVNMKCAANKVRASEKAQKFHERPGMMRKRLASSRWQKRFKEAFRATVRRVEDMRRKGW